MVRSGIRTRGMKDIEHGLEVMLKRANNPKRIAKKFERYIMEDRIRNMFRNGGRVMGKWGKGFTKWEPNSPLVRLLKGDRRVFYKHGRNKSSVELAYKFFARVLTARAQFRLTNDHPHKDALQDGVKSRVIYPKKKDGVLRFPIGFGMFAFARYVFQPKDPLKSHAIPPRHIEGFQEGDEKKLIDIAEKDLLEPIK